eukprot:scaffold1442_cov109-Isochrysis_galbana.AAC.1
MWAAHRSIPHMHLGGPRPGRTCRHASEQQACKSLTQDPGHMRPCITAVRAGRGSRNITAAVSPRLAQITSQAQHAWPWCAPPPHTTGLAVALSSPPATTPPTIPPGPPPQ